MMDQSPGLPPTRGIQEKSRNCIFNHRKSNVTGRFSKKSRNIRKSFTFLILSFQGGDFLSHTQSHTQLNVITVKYYPFVYNSVLCSHFEAQFRFVMKPES